MKTKKNHATADTSTTHFPLYQNYNRQGTSRFKNLSAWNGHQILSLTLKLSSVQPIILIIMFI